MTYDQASWDALYSELERLRAVVVAGDREIKASHADADRLRAELAAANNRLAIQFGMHPGGDLAKGALIERERAVAAERERCAQLVVNCYGMSVEEIAAAIRRGEP